MSSKQHEHRTKGENPPAQAEADSSSQTATSADRGQAQMAEPGAAQVGVEQSEKAAGAEKRLAELDARVAALVEENSSLKDQYLRKLADYENFRKRMFREKEEAQKYAISGLLSDLVPVLDDFDRAVASAEHAQEYQVLHDGVVLIRRQMGSLLENKYGLMRYESLGKPFDPNVHEALSTEPGEAGGEPLVAEEYLPGYRLHDRVVRSAKVRVRMPSPAATSSSAGEDRGSKAEQNHEQHVAESGGGGNGGEPSGGAASTGR